MPKTILLADDSITIQKVVGITFANEDFEVVAVDNGEAALARARELQPDVILADVVMPRKNGYELCEAVKSDPALRHVPVLLLAGTFEAFDEGRARSAHADGHLSKPFDSQALINKVRELTGGAPVAAPEPVRLAPAAPAPQPAPVAAAPRAPAPNGAAPRPGTIPQRPAPGVTGPRPFDGGAPAAFRPPAPGQPAAAPPRPGAPPPGARPFAAAPPNGAAPRPAGPGAQGYRPPPGAPLPGVRPPGAPVPAARGAPVPSGIPRPGFAPVGPAGQRPLAPGARPAAPAVPGPRPGAPAAPGVRPGAARPPAAAGPGFRPPSAPPGAARPAPSPHADPFGFGGFGAPSTQVRDDDWSGVARPTPAPVPGRSPRADALGREAAPRPPGPLDLPDLEGDDGLAPPHASVPPAAPTGHAPEPAARAGPGDGGEALLREALSRASREVIERVVWEVVPELAETIIRENLDRLVKQRQG